MLPPHKVTARRHPKGRQLMQRQGGTEQSSRSVGRREIPPALTIGDKLRAAIRTSRSTMTLNGQKNGDPSITTFPAARQLDPLVERRSDCGYSLKKREKQLNSWL